MTICCPTCQTPLGETDGQVLRIGNVVFIHTIVLTCATCGHGHRWRAPKTAQQRREKERIRSTSRHVA